jgi:hypothetical protein
VNRLVNQINIATIREIRRKRAAGNQFALDSAYMLNSLVRFICRHQDALPIHNPETLLIFPATNA